MPVTDPTLQKVYNYVREGGTTVPSPRLAGRLLAATALALVQYVLLANHLVVLPALLLPLSGELLLVGDNAYDRGRLLASLSIAGIAVLGIVLGLLGHRAGVHVRYRDPPLRPSTAGAVRLLAATAVGACLFLVLYGRLLGGVAFGLTIGSGVLLIVFLAGYNGYDGGIALTAVSAAAIITTGIVAAMLVTDVQALATSGPSHADIPGGNGESLFWLFPAVCFGLLVHRGGRRVRNWHSTAE